jgi:tetraacyldisaccharide 4'-kinase
VLASLGYGLGARLHRAVARRLVAARGRPSCAIVSVGGLSMGGAGKTPLAAALASGLRRRGLRVAIASRGYRGASREPVTIVSDGSHVRASVEAVGDEALVLAAHAPGVSVLVGRDRRLVGHRAVSLFDTEVLVLDDGFQHHRLARDLDIVCVDGASGFGNGHVLPWGPLREPLSTLRFADWLCLVDPVEGRSPPAAVEAFEASGRPVWRAHRRPTALVALEEGEPEPPSRLAGLRVGMLAGIARPASLRRTLEALGARVVAERLFPDHHAYAAGDLGGLDPGVDLWITTEKDAFKILPRWLGDRELRVLRIEIELEEERALLDRLQAHLASSPSRALAPNAEAPSSRP